MTRRGEDPLAIPLLVTVGNVAVFVAAGTWMIGGGAGLSHHWLFPFHEWLLLVQAFALARLAPARTLTLLSLLVLGVSIARVNTVFLSHHLIHVALAWALAAPLHHRLSRMAWRGFNVPFRTLAGIWAVVLLAAAMMSGVWWGVGDGT